jgi:WD40 repeat protein
LGDFEEAERLQAGIREWLLRAARHGRHELRGLPAPAVLPLLCAAAFGPSLAQAAELDGAAAAARIRVLSSVGASALAEAVAAAVDRARSARPSASPSRSDLQREISRSLKETLSAGDADAAAMRSDMAMVLREIDAGGTAFRAAIESGDEELEREVLAAAETVSAEFGEMEFLLADLARAAGEIQDSLGSQGAGLRAELAGIARQSADVRVIREQLAVIEQRGRPWLPGPGLDGPRWTGGCPYRGLRPYGPAQEAVFFGRKQLTAALAGTLAQSGLVMLTGAAGAGKTSLLAAGLEPALARGVQVSGSAAWPRISMTAGPRPLTELAAQLARLGQGDPGVLRDRLAGAPDEANVLFSEIAQAAGGSRLVLITDQFEQVFAAGDEEARRERAAFIAAVHAGATRGPEPPLFAVIAVRGDYWDRCAAYPQLIPSMERDQVVVGPMTEAELRQVITGPAAAAGLAIEPGLTDAILADLGAQQPAGGGVLPLLSQALAVTWEHSPDHRLTRQAYLDAVGSVARSVEVSAETAYRGLTEGQRGIAREVFRRLTGTGPDGRAARRTARDSDLRPAGDWPAVSAVLEAFARHRLVTLDGDHTEMAHDVLLQAWPRLKGWLAEDETSMILHGQLAEDTQRWQAGGGDGGGDGELLYRGLQLAAAEQAARVWAEDPGRFPPLEPGEAKFLRASSRSAGRRRRSRQALAGLVAVLVIAALAGAGVAVKDTRASVARQNAASTAQQLAAQSTALDATDPVTAALLAGAAWRLDPTAQGRYSLLQSLAQPVRGVLTASSGVVTALAYSLDGRTLAAGYSSGTIRLWDLAAHRATRVTTFDGAPAALAFTDRGKVLEAADASAVGTWNLAASAGISTHPLSSPGQGSAVAFSPDGSAVATGGADGNVRLFAAATGQEIGSPMSSDLDAVDAVAFSPDGTLVASASADGNVQQWNVASQQVAGSALIPNGPTVDALAFSPDSKLLATGGQDGTVRVWPVGSSGPATAVLMTGDPVSAVTFGPGGTTLGTAESDGGTQLWNVDTHAQTGAALAMPGSTAVSTLRFSPDAGTLATGNGSGSIQLWDAAGFHQVSAPLGVGPVSPATAFSASGGLLATADGQGTVRIWDLSAGRPAGNPVSSPGTVTGLALSPDGKTVAVAGAGGVQLWQTATGQRIGSTLPAAGQQQVAFSPAGTSLATYGADGTVRIWAAGTQRETGTPISAGRPAALTGAVAFSPDGKTLLTLAAGGQVRRWDVATQRPIGPPMAAGPAATMATFSPDGRTLATAGRDGTVRLWDVATQQQAGRAMTADAQPVDTVAFSADSRMLVTAGGDGSVRLWDVATQQQVGRAMTAGTAAVYAAAFVPGGSVLATADADGTARLWDVAFPASLAQAACGIAGEPISRQQWALYAGNQPYQPVCPAG